MEAVQASVRHLGVPRLRHQDRRTSIAAPIDLKIVRDIWLVSHEETNKGARIRTVIDYVRDQFRQDEREWFSLPACASSADRSGLRRLYDSAAFSRL